MDKKTKNLAYVLMLDTSPSMGPVLEQLRINAKAFVACSFAGDQFAVCQFCEEAYWIYPQAAQLVTVSEGAAPEVLEASRQIDKLTQTGRLTNIGAAINLGNQAIATSSADFDAFVLLSDGEHNTGVSPETVLGDTPPIFVAAMRNELSPGYFDKLVAKNPISKAIKATNYSDMMKLFNEIRGFLPNVRLLKNERLSLPPKSSVDFPVDVASAEGTLRVSVVWPAEHFRYSAQPGVSETIYVCLKSPNGQVSNDLPLYEQGGFCIFNKEMPFSGEWILHIENNSMYNCDNTLGVFFMENDTTNVHPKR